MHILTGFLLAGLLGKNKFRRRTLMPMLRTGPVQTAHFVPGRVRLRVPSLTENDAGAAMVREQLPTIRGVQSVNLNPATGSVLIVYREDEVRPELLFADVERLKRIAAGAGKIQIVFAGKAHPRDQEGKEIIHRIFEVARSLHREIPVAFWSITTWRSRGLWWPGSMFG